MSPSAHVWGMATEGDVLEIAAGVSAWSIFLAFVAWACWRRMPRIFYPSSPGELLWVAVGLYVVAGYAAVLYARVYPRYPTCVMPDGSLWPRRLSARMMRPVGPLPTAPCDLDLMCDPNSWMNSASECVVVVW